VQVAGAEADGVLDEAIHENTDLKAPGGQFGLEILNGIAHNQNLTA
jgi:hypothetical protein